MNYDYRNIGDVNFDKLTRNQLYSLNMVLVRGVNGLCRRLYREEEKLLGHHLSSHYGVMNNISNHKLTRKDLRLLSKIMRTTMLTILKRLEVKAHKIKIMSK